MKTSQYSFGEFDLDVDRYLLTKRGEAIPLSTKTVALLVTLIENHNVLLTKNELLDRVWENQFVEENNLTVHIAALRKALGEKRGDHRYIVTVPGVGYRFVAPLKEAATDVVVERRTFERIVIEESEEQVTPASENSEDILALPAAGNGHWTKLVLGVLAIAVVAGLAYWLFTNRTASSDRILFKDPSFSRLTSSGKVTGAALSPDGNYFVYAQEESIGQSLWVRQAGESRALEIIPADAVEYWGLTFTPTGTHIYATAFTASQADPKLIRFPVIGGVVEDLPNVSCSNVSFSPDGRRFAYVVSSSGVKGTLLRTANADGSDDQVLAVIRDPSYFVYPGTTVAWSPNGNEIAIATKVVDETGDRGTVMIVSVADGTMQPYISRRFPWVQSVAWFPDGKGLVFTANEDASTPMQVWRQAGRDTEPVRITNDINWYSWITMNRDGGLLLAIQSTTNSSLWISDFTGKIDDAKQIANEIGEYGELGWLPDGRIVFRSAATGKQNLWAINSDGTGPRQLTTDAMPDKGLDVSPDGRFIVFSSFRAGKYNLWRVDSDGGNLAQLTDGPGEVLPRITPDSRFVIYQQGVGEIRSSLSKMPIEGGQAVQVVSAHAVYPSLSPDGKLVSYFYMDRSASDKGEWKIGIAETETGRQIMSFAQPEKIIGRVVRWTPDNSSIVYAKSNGSVGNLWLQPLTGAEPVQITNFDRETIADFTWSNDGRWLAISRATPGRDVVSLESREPR